MNNYPVKFGKYLLLERVNVGGMAEIFKAKTFGVAGFERILAIKRILPNLVEDDEFIRMFIDEARIAVQLNHPNIAQIYELGKHGEHYYMAMEYLASRDLRTILDRMRGNGQLMPIVQAAYVCKKVAEGLDYAHKKRDVAGNPMHIIHRDVSPQNVLLGYEGDVKVIDFGIAKAANRASKTQAGVLKGKFGYMSPEQVRGLPTDRRSDIFAVGVLLYEMVTGERLFIGESDFSTLERVRNAEVPPPTNFNKKITREFEQIMLKALAREVEDRFQWAGELAEALEPFVREGKQPYTTKHLSASLKEIYAAEIAVEKQKHEQFLRLTGEDVVADGVDPSTVSLQPQDYYRTTDSAVNGNTQEPAAVLATDDLVEHADKTFVIEASVAGFQLLDQPTAVPQAPVVSQWPTSSPAPKIPWAQAKGAAPTSESSATNTLMKSKRSGPTNEEVSEEHSLYDGGDGDDSDDARTLVSAPNPYFPADSNGGRKEPRRENNDVDGAEADTIPPPAQAAVPVQPAPPAIAAARDQLDRASSRPPRETASPLSPAAEEISATKTAWAQRGAALDPVTLAFDEDERMALAAVPGSRPEGPSQNVMDLQARSDRLGVGPSSGAAVALGGLQRPPRESQGASHFAMHPEAPRAMAGESGRDLVGGPQLPSTSFGVRSDDSESSSTQAVPQLAHDDDVDVRHLPPRPMKAMVATLAASALMFLAVLAVLIAKLTGGGSSIELYAIGDVAPPQDLKVLMDGLEVRGLGVPLALVDEQPHLVTVTGSGIAPVQRKVRGKGEAMRQPVLLVAAVRPPPPDVVALPMVPSAPGDQVPAGQLAALDFRRTVAPPVGGGWRLSLATVADDTGKPVSDAEIFVEGQLYGRTPLEAELDFALDNVTVRLKKDGFVTRELTVARAGRDRVGPATVRLVPGATLQVKPPAVEDPPYREMPTAPPPVIAPAPVAPLRSAVTVAQVDRPPVVEKKVAKVISPLQIGTQPFADTVIDGRRFGSTPFYGQRKLEVTVGKHKVEFTDKNTGKKYRFEFNIQAPDAENKVVIVLTKDDPPRVTGKMSVKPLP